MMNKIRMKLPHVSGSAKPIKRSISGNVAIFILLFLLCVFSALPLVYTIIQSIKPMDEIFAFPPRFFVKNPTTENFYMLSQLTQSLWVPYSRYIFNSVFVTITATFLHVLFASMAAFPLAKYRFPGSGIIFYIIILSLLFTSEVTGIPSFILMSRAYMLNSYSALILPPIASSLGLFLMKQFISQVPDAVIEAGRVDGAGIFRIYWNIVMPAVKPAWLTLIVFGFQGIWNREGLEFIYKESLKTLPTVLRQITSSGIARSGAASAAALILVIPPVLVFLFTQSNVIETMTHSGIKE